MRVRGRHRPAHGDEREIAESSSVTVLRWRWLRWPPCCVEWLDRYFGTEMPTFITWYPAVLAVASVAGGGPGVLATILSALVADYWFVTPTHSFAFAKASDAVAFGIFVGTGIFLSVLMGVSPRTVCPGGQLYAERERANLQAIFDATNVGMLLVDAGGTVNWRQRYRSRAGWAKTWAHHRTSRATCWAASMPWAMRRGAGRRRIAPHVRFAIHSQWWYRHRAKRP